MTNFIQLLLASACVAVCNHGTADALRVTTATIGYFGMKAYQQQSAALKLNDLWTQTLADTSVGAQSYKLDNLFKQSPGTSFGWKSDELPEGRPKINHAQGVVGKVIWEDLGDHPYTGLYAGGSLYGLVRLSEGNFMIPEASGLTPTMALKFLYDGIESLNIVANTSFESSSSWNFFAKDFRTHIELFQDPIAQETIELKFAEATDNVNAVGKAELAKRAADTSAVANPVAPYDLYFSPHPDLSTLWPDEKQYDANNEQISFLQQLKQIQSGQILFQVMARDYPENDERDFPQGSTLKHIGNIRLTSELTTSLFGDSRLFFQHIKLSEDFVLQPKFRSHYERVTDTWGDKSVPEWPQDSATQKAWVRGSIEEYGCPFAWLLGNTITPLFS